MKLKLNTLLSSLGVMIATFGAWHVNEALATETAELYLYPEEKLEEEQRELM
jgi:hypothetical protein